MKTEKDTLKNEDSPKPEICSASCKHRKEAEQNWRLFEVSAENLRRSLEEYNTLLWGQMEWESVAHELARFVRPGWDDADKALGRYESLKSGKTRTNWVKAREVNTPGRWYWARISGTDEQEDTYPQVVFITIDDDGVSAPDWRVLFVGEDESTAKKLSRFDERGWEFMEIPLPNVL
jgi:hypothetical protein